MTAQKEKGRGDEFATKVKAHAGAEKMQRVQTKHDTKQKQCRLLQRDRLITLFCTDPGCSGPNLLRLLYGLFVAYF